MSGAVTPPPAPWPISSAARAAPARATCARAGPWGGVVSLPSASAVGSDGGRKEARQEPSSEPVRGVEWWWASRLVRTRQLGAEGVKGGGVHINGRAVKPSKE